MIRVCSLCLLCVGLILAGLIPLAVLGSAAIRPFRVVIDAGHGGRDSGARSRDNYKEKQAALDIALTLGKILESKEGVEVVYTRNRDVYIPLTERVRIANGQKADLFVSIHMNSSRSSRAFGTETYIYGRKSSSMSASEIAERENEGQSLKEIVLDGLRAATYETRSLMAAEEVVAELKKRPVGLTVRRVGRMPFYVIAKTQMPAMLIEVAFISNPSEEAKLKNSWWRQDVALAICQAINNYRELIQSNRQ